MLIAATTAKKSEDYRQIALAHYASASSQLTDLREVGRA